MNRRIEALRTSDERFAGLPGFDFEPHYLDGLPFARRADGTFERPGVVSRKKQLLPYLTHCLRQFRA